MSLSPSVCMCGVCVVWTDVWGCMCGGQRLTLDIFFCCGTPFYLFVCLFVCLFETESLTEPGAHGLANKLWRFLCLCTSRAGVTCACYCSQISQGCWGSELRSPYLHSQRLLCSRSHLPSPVTGLCILTHYFFLKLFWALKIQFNANNSSSFFWEWIFFSLRFISDVSAGTWTCVFYKRSVCS